MNVTNSRILRIGAFVVPVLLLIGIISMRAISTDSTPQAETLARTAGLDFVTVTEGQWNKGWTNVTLTDARSIYDLDGEEIGYRFSVRSGSSVVGTIVVGGADFSYQPFELIPVSDKAAPNGTELASVIERDLDRTTYSGQPTSSDKLLYLGYSQKYELYEIGGQEVAFHLEDRRMTPKSDLTSSLTTARSGSGHSETQRVLAATGLGFDTISARTTGGGHWDEWEKIHGVPVYGQYSDDVDDNYKPNNCGPTTGAMIVDYYRLREDFDDFDGWTENHDALYDSMGTDDCPPCFGTLPGTFASGFEDYADDKGYDFDTTVSYTAPSLPAVMSSIADDRPMAVMFASCQTAPDLHWNAVVGWGIWVDEDDYEFNYIITKDPGGSNGFEAVISWSENFSCINLVEIEED